MSNETHIDYLSELQKICSKYHDNSCYGCPFDSGTNNYININCDSGVYNKYEWDIKGIKEAIKQENRDART